MHFGWSPEQLAMKEAASGFLAASPGPRAMEARWPDGLWARVVEEQGWPAVAVPESLGGWGFGVLDLSVVFEELGRRLTPCPMLSTTALALPVLVAAGAADVVAAVLAGETATLARGPVDVQPVAGGWKVQGTLTGVPDGALADWVVVVDQGRAMVVRPDATIARASLDTTRPLADVVLDQVVPDERCFQDVDTDAAWRQSLVLLAAEQVGVAEAAMDLAVAYSKVRHQYGKAIGSFQAIQHRCADMLNRVESARSAMMYAAWAVDAGRPEADMVVATAAALAGEAATWVTGESIQVHGGIGFTWEHDCHLYFKRARANLALMGAPHTHRARVAAALLDGGEVWI